MLKKPEERKKSRMQNNRYTQYIFKFCLEPGMTVYEVNQYRNCVDKLTVRYVTFHRDGYVSAGVGLEGDLFGTQRSLHTVHESDIGETIFFKKEEAEAALKGSTYETGCNH